MELLEYTVDTTGKGDLLHAKHLTVVEIGWHHVEYTYFDNGLYMCTRVYVYIKYVYVCIYINIYICECIYIYIYGCIYK